MDHKKALEILEIDVVDYEKINLDYLKKKYHKLALQNHPDKNDNTIESNEKFKQINEAYNFLKREIDHLNFNEKETNDYEYTDILHLFLAGLMNGKYTELFTNIIKEIVTTYKTNISTTIFEGLDRETSLNVYSFLSKYHSLFHLSPDVLKQVKEIIMDKFNDITVYTLNPSIKDLFDNNVYKLCVDGEIYLVPLWHHELYFDSKKEKEIIVICDPQLPKGVKIDEDNNLYTEVSICANNVFKEDPNIQIMIGNKQFEIPVSSLYIKKEQIYRIRNQGISKVKDDYGIREKADIVVRIFLT
jgi:hypothetical protein